MTTHPRHPRKLPPLGPNDYIHIEEPLDPDDDRHLIDTLADRIDHLESFVDHTFRGYANWDHRDSDD
jgi:hypothetical protein